MAATPVSQAKQTYRFALAFVLLGLPRWSQAFEQPSVNLGASSFFDGLAAFQGSEAEKGFYFNQYFQYYTADRFNDNQGRAIPGAPRLDVYTSLTQLIFLMDKPSVFGAHLGFDALIPLVSIDASPGNTLLSPNRQALGDLTVGVALQFDPILVDSHPVFMHRIDLDVIVPTGHYDPAFALNPGANFLSFNPYWAGTLFLCSKVVTSWRAHYLWNDVNDRPPRAIYPPGTEEVQAGHAVHLNFDVACNVYDQRLYAGVNGYYFKQLSDTRINGVSAAGTKEQVLGIGPGAVFRFNKHASFFFNAYFETAVENRTSGMRLNSLFAFHF
jgi:hypothetical protein